MCGIVYAEDFQGNPVNNLIMQQFDQQRNRGIEGFGIFDGVRKHLVHEAKENKILNWLVNHDSSLLLMHHRFPTSTINVKPACHPFSTKDYFGDTQYIMVHNGMIRNSDDLYVKHQELGIDYQSLLRDMTFNDSEALMWDLALTLEGKQDHLTAYGSIAFICLKLEGGVLSKMYFGRNTSPLNMYREKSGIMLSSEGEGEAIDTQKLYTWNYALKRLTKREMNIPSYDPDFKWASNTTRGSGYVPQEYSYPMPYQAKRWNSWEDDEYEDNYEDEVDYEYEQNDKGFYVPVKSDRQLLTEGGIQVPDEDEIRETALRWLGRHKGHFEQAYWSLEAMYEKAEEQPDTLDNIRRRFLFEKAIYYLQDDPEYIHEDSVSSLGEALWQQENLLTIL